MENIDKLIEEKEMMENYPDQKTIEDDLDFSGATPGVDRMIINIY